MNQQDASECVFDILYLTTLYCLTLKIFQRRAVRRENYLLTWMCSSLVVGDSIHLLPRLAVIIFNLQSYSRVVNGVGFLSGAIAITLFQRILLEVIECRYQQDSGMWYSVMKYLFATRLVLLLLPANHWFDGVGNPLLCKVRNIPAFLMGGITSLLLFTHSRGKGDAFRWMWLYNALSFVALIPTSFFHAGGLVAVAFIMLHTVCYVLMIVCSYRAAKEEVEKKEECSCLFQILHFHKTPPFQSSSNSTENSTGNIFEAVFCIIYLILVLYAGFAMLFNRQDSHICLLFSLMCLILGFGDCFHLIPRIYSLMAGVSEKVNAALGIGNMITAIGMTVFYLLFVEVIGLYYNRSVKVWRIICLILFAARVVTLLLPQNDWIHNTFDPTMSLIRNIPFIAIGVIVVCLLLVCTYQVDGDPLRLMWVYVTVSFGCYAPVALVHFGDYRDAILMIVKTIAYLRN